MNDFKLISIDKWERDYKPVLDKAEHGGYVRDFYTVDEVQDYIKQHGYDVYNVWSLVDGDDGVGIVMTGWHWCNCYGYHVTENKWEEGVDINTFSGGGYECKIEQIHEDIECMDECIKKGKDLDYYGETKEEQDEMRQMFLDDIKYCEEEIKNYEKLLEEEKLSEVA